MKPTAPSSARDWTPALVAAVTAAVFLPCLRGEILDFDDRLFVNPARNIPTAANVLDLFMHPHAANYVPVASVSHLLDALVWGNLAAGHHLTSLILHVANAALVYLVLRALLGEARHNTPVRAAAAVGALFFALHPLRVQSVAWIAERRDVLCGFFCLSTILLYLRAGDAPGGERGRWRAWSLAAYAAALGSKAAAVPLPLGLVVLDAARGRIPTRPFSGGAAAKNYWTLLVPYGALALLGALSAWGAQVAVGAVVDATQFPLSERLVTVTANVGFYIGKSAWPHALTFYERVRPGLIYPAALVGWVILAAGAVAAKFVDSWRRPLMAAVAFYVVMLATTIGFFPVGHELAADRYSYLPSFALSALVAAGFLTLFRRAPRSAGSAAAVILLALVVVTRSEIPRWHDENSLWRSTLQRDLYSEMARPNLVYTLLKAGRDGEAMIHLEDHLRLYPKQPTVEAELATIYRRIGSGPETHAKAYEQLGQESSARGERAKAEWFFRKALKFSPNSKIIARELGGVAR